MSRSGILPGGLPALEGVPAATLRAVLHRTRAMEAAVRRRLPGLAGRLQGRTVASLFYEPSTRTALSFQTAAERLGARVLQVGAQGSSIEKGESLADSGRTLAALGAEAVILRHPSSGAAAYLSQQVGVPVVNAGDGMHEHPTQGLLDLYTVLRHRNRIEGLQVTIIGDVLHSRVARSDAFGFSALGARVRLAGPPGFAEPDLARGLGLALPVCSTLEEALEGADVVIVLRVQRERIRRELGAELGDYVRRWRLESRHLEAARPGALLLHPGPVNRGVELSEEVLASPACLINRQVEYGVFTRMAVLDEVLGGDDAAGVDLDALAETDAAGGGWMDEPVAAPAGAGG